MMDRDRAPEQQHRAAPMLVDGPIRATEDEQERYAEQSVRELGLPCIPVPKKLQARLDASSTLVAKAGLRVCFDRAGKVDAVTVLDVGPDLPEFGELSERAVRRWKVSPFKVRGNSVRACGTIVTAYPGSRLSPSDRVPTAAYPPPPAP